MAMILREVRKKVRKMSVPERQKDLGVTDDEVNFTMFSRKEIEMAISNGEFLGEGVYVEVYMAKLHRKDVAIKIRTDYSSSAEKRYSQEVDVLKMLRHPNIVTLVGACPEQRALVYAFLPGGTLEDRLACRNNKLPLTWQARIDIAYEICSALFFLHSSKPYSIVHANLKPRKILFDQDDVIKLIGLSNCVILSQPDHTRKVAYCSTNPKGTIGYIDPYFVETHELTTLADVYAFGVVLLRLLTNRPAITLVNKVEVARENQCLEELLDRTAEWPSELAEELSDLGLRCCRRDWQERPVAVEAVEMLRCIKHRASFKKLSKKELKMTNLSEKELEMAISNSNSKLLCYGISGMIYMAELRKKNLAIKLRYGNSFDACFLQEANILRMVRHPNVVTLLGECKENNALVYEFLPGGTLEDRLACRNNRPPLNWRARIRIAYEICSVLVFLHSIKPHGIVHGNLLYTNILFDAHNTVKITGFCCSRILRQSDLEKTTRWSIIAKGSVGYIDPLFLQSRELTTKADIYSIGIILLELLTNKSLMDVVYQVHEAQVNDRLSEVLDGTAKWHTKLAQELSTLALRCCTVDGRERPHATEVLEILQRMKMVFESSSDAETSEGIPADGKKNTVLELQGTESQHDDEASNKTHKFTDLPKLWKKEHDNVKWSDITMFSYSELVEATANFNDSKKLGQGGFGIVYKGNLHYKEVAIKMIKAQGNEEVKAFHLEVDVLSVLIHPHLVPLIGACRENYALVYEFMPGGTLEDRLAHKDLLWLDRIRIATEICSALLFLHSLKPIFVVHGDLKPTNVLLDANDKSKLGDFGICRLIAPSNTESTAHHVTSMIQGSTGYLDPFVFQNQLIKPSIDVYALGMVLLRLVTNHPPGYCLIVQVQHALENKFEDVLDPAAQWPSQVAEKLSRLALKCCDLVSQKHRPNTSEIFKKLKELEQGC